MFFFFLVFFTVFSAVNYYITIRGWQALQGVPVLRIIYLILLLIAAFSFLLARIFSKYLPVPVYDILTWIGSFWFAYILYVLIFIIILDGLRLGNYYFNFFPPYVKKNYMLTKQITFAAVFLLSTIIIIAGYINTRSVKVTNLNIDIPRRMSTLDNLKIAVASDLHLTTMNNEAFLENVVNKINSLEPDIILIPGDIVDETEEYYNKKGIGNAFRSLKAKYGVYASTGNHEYIVGAEESVKYIKSKGINVLRDEYTLIENKFYLVGREDSSKTNFTKVKRKTLKEITSDINPDYPVILLDHTPFNLDEASLNKVDLQVSGHTHHGQMFPLNFITKLIYEVSWGYKKKNDTHYYVSSGAGTWGPPVRTGSSTEIVLINVKFL